MGLDSIQTRSARPLPVIILADTSGSMSEHGKIEALNRAIREMIDSFAEEEADKVSIEVGVVRFGGDVEVHTEPTPAEEMEWEDLSAQGKTPLGEAYETVRDMIEDRDIVPSRAYRPTLVLVSDGIPTDRWKESLQKLTESDRASKADRLAMGIGPDADEQILEEFVKNSLEMGVFGADDAADIHQFFQVVTMTVATRTRSGNPNLEPDSIEADIDDLVF